MPEEINVDGTFFEFPESWLISQFDTAPQFKAASGPLGIKGCDIVAIDGSTLWLIEMKDYTYEEASQPQDLAQVVGQKAAGTMSMLYALERTENESSAKTFAQACKSTQRIHLALHIEVKDGGRKAAQILAVLAPLKEKLQSSQKALGLSKAYVTTTLAPNAATPWSSRRDPATRQRHSDR